MWGLGIVFVAQALEIEKRMRARRRRQRWERIRAWMDKYDVPFGLRLLRNSAIALALFAAVVFLVGAVAMTFIGALGLRARRMKDVADSNTEGKE